MPNLWRITHKDFVDLSGAGGLHASGRWHIQGRPIVYLAEHPALAMLEVRVNMDLGEYFLKKYMMMKIEIADNIKIAIFDDNPFDEITCQKLGDAWLEKQETALCKVRSVAAPQSYNFLLNPIHKDASKIKIIDILPLVDV